jgi:spore maturation protein CgeB
LRDLGQKVIEFNLNDRITFYDAAYMNISEGKFRKALDGETAVDLAVNGLYAALYKIRPDVLLAVSAFLLPAELMDLARWYGTKVIILHTEAPYENVRQIEIAAHADLNLVNDPTDLEQFHAAGPSLYMPQAYRSAVHHPGPPEPDLAADFAFVGTGFESRIAFFEAMDLDGLDVLLGGNWQRLAEDSPLRKYVGHDIAECLDNTETARIYRSAKVGLNLYRRETEDGCSAEGWAIGPREVEMAACGMPFLRDSRGEGDELFPMLPTFGSPEEASEKLRWFLAHEDTRLNAASKAREAIADRTFRNHAATLLQLLEKE